MASFKRIVSPFGRAPMSKGTHHTVPALPPVQNPYPPIVREHHTSGEPQDDAPSVFELFAARRTRTAPLASA